MFDAGMPRSIAWLGHVIRNMADHGEPLLRASASTAKYAARCAVMDLDKIHAARLDEVHGPSPVLSRVDDDAIPHTGFRAVEHGSGAEMRARSGSSARRGRQPVHGLEAAAGIANGGHAVGDERGAGNVADVGQMMCISQRPGIRNLPRPSTVSSAEKLRESPCRILAIRRPEIRTVTLGQAARPSRR